MQASILWSFTTEERGRARASLALVSRAELGILPAGVRHRRDLAALHWAGALGTQRGIRVLRVVRRVVPVEPSTLQAMRLGCTRRVLEPEIPVLPLGGLPMKVVGKVAIGPADTISHP